MKLSILIATLGRATLTRTLESIRPQLASGDEVLVIGDGDRPIAQEQFERSGLPGKYLIGPVTKGEGGGGGDQRTFGTRHATGTHLLYIDDDDVYSPGALGCVRKAIDSAPGRILIFRVYLTWTKGFIWKTPVAKLANITTGGLCVPNDPERLAPWGSERICDWQFLEGTMRNFPPVIFQPEVICVARPK